MCKNLRWLNGAADQTNASFGTDNNQTPVSLVVTDPVQSRTATAKYCRCAEGHAILPRACGENVDQNPRLGR